MDSCNYAAIYLLWQNSLSLWCHQNIRLPANSLFQLYRNVMERLWCRWSWNDRWIYFHAEVCALAHCVTPQINWASTEDNCLAAILLSDLSEMSGFIVIEHALWAGHFGFAQLNTYNALLLVKCETTLPGIQSLTRVKPHLHDSRSTCFSKFEIFNGGGADL